MKSDWQMSTMELYKTLRGDEDAEYVKGDGSIDVLVDEEDKTTLIRALVDKRGVSSRGYVETINKTLDDIDENEDIDEVILLAESFTSSARRMLNKRDNLTYLTPDVNPMYRISDLLYAIQRKTIELCELVCGKPPETEKDCKGYDNKSYSCQIRRISDDATFHAKMKWDQVLLEDFQKLVELQKNPDLLEVN
jgi:hypothetical protein